MEKSKSRRDSAVAAERLIEPRLFVFDVEAKRPACALVQALYGGDSGLLMYFDSRTWITHPTKTMQVFRIDSEQSLEDLKKVAELCNEHAK